MSQSKSDRAASARRGEDRWRSLYRATAYVGIATNIVVFGLYVPQIGAYISMLSVVGYVTWYILIARRLIRLGWGVSPARA